MSSIDPSLPPPADFLQTLRNRLHRALSSFAKKRFNGYEHEDLVQDAFLKLVADWPEITKKAIERADGRNDLTIAVVNQLVAYLTTTVGFKARRDGSRDRSCVADPESLQDARTIGPQQGATADVRELATQWDKLLDTLEDVDRQILLDKLHGIPAAETAANLGTTDNAINLRWSRLRARLNRHTEWRRISEALLDAYQGVNEATYAGSDDEAIATQFAPVIGEPRQLLLRTTVIRWHRDGFVRAVVSPSIALPSVCIGVALLRGHDDSDQTPSAPFCLSFDNAAGTLPGSTTQRLAHTTLAAWFGAPPRSDRSGDGLLVPAGHFAVALTH